MPFLRRTRDSRGYENTFVVHIFRRKGRNQSRILYWYRTPPGVRVGRAPLDEEAMRSIERRYPELKFDWPALLSVQPSMGPGRGGPTDERATSGFKRYPAPGRRAIGPPRPAPAPNAPIKGRGPGMDVPAKDQGIDTAVPAEVTSEGSGQSPAPPALADPNDALDIETQNTLGQGGEARESTADQQDRTGGAHKRARRSRRGGRKRRRHSTGEPASTPADSGQIPAAQQREEPDQ